MSITTIPFTNGGKRVRRRLIEKPSRISTTEATRHAPKTAASPYSRPITMMPVTKAMLVPMMTGIRPPTGPMGYACTRIAMPAMKNTACMSNAVSAPERLSAPATSSGGVMLPSSIATRCWNPSGTASRRGGRSSTPYTTCLRPFWPILSLALAAPPSPLHPRLSAIPRTSAHLDSRTDHPVPRQNHHQRRAARRLSRGTDAPERFPSS